MVCPGAIAKAVPNLTLTKSAQINGQPASEAAPGDIITYTITYQNSGAGDAVKVIITDPIPQGTKFYGSITGSGVCSPAPDETCTLITWNLGAIPAQGQAGASGEVGFQVRVVEGYY